MQWNNLHDLDTSNEEGGRGEGRTNVIFIFIFVESGRDYSGNRMGIEECLSE